MPWYPSQEEIDELTKDAYDHQDDLCSIHSYRIIGPDTYAKVEIDTGTHTVSIYPGGK